MRHKMKFDSDLKKNLFTLVFIAGEMKWISVFGVVVVQCLIKKSKTRARYRSEHVGGNYLSLYWRRFTLNQHGSCSNKGFKFWNIRQITCIHWLVWIFLYSDWIQGNTHKKKTRIWTLFTQWDLTTNVADFKLLSKQLQRHEKIMYVSDHFVPL